MVNLFNIYKKDDIDMVEVRKYCGMENDGHAWIFLGYDFVCHDDKNRHISILADDGDVHYDYVPKIMDRNSIDFGLYDHRQLKNGDIRIFNVSRISNPFKTKYVSLATIKSWIDENPQYSFMNYDQEKGKVKKMSTR